MLPIVEAIWHIQIFLVLSNCVHRLLIFIFFSVAKKRVKVRKSVHSLKCYLFNKQCQCTLQTFSIRLPRCWWIWWMNWWWIVFVVWLTKERRLALFPAGRRIWTCVEPEFRISCMKLITTTPRLHLGFREDSYCKTISIT